jgi:hypothetical protein
MRDPLWYAPITLTLATFGGAALIAVLLVADRRFYTPRDTAIVAGVAAAALVAALVGVAVLAGWIARLPRPGVADAVLASTVGGLMVNAVAGFLAGCGFALPGLVAAWAVRGQVGLAGALGALLGGLALVGTATYFSTTGRLVWLARADQVIVERSGLVSTLRTPLADVVGVEVHQWRHVAHRYNDAALRLRPGTGRRFDAIPLGLPGTLAAATREADRAAAAVTLPRLPDRDLGAALATPR